MFDFLPFYLFVWQNVEDKNWICYLSEAYKKYSFKEDKFLIKQRSPIKHREYRTRHDRLRRKTISKVEGILYF